MRPQARREELPLLSHRASLGGAPPCRLAQGTRNLWGDHTRARGPSEVALAPLPARSTQRTEGWRMRGADQRPPDCQCAHMSRGVGAQLQLGHHPSHGGRNAATARALVLLACPPVPWGRSAATARAPPIPWGSERSYSSGTTCPVGIGAQLQLGHSSCVYNVVPVGGGHCLPIACVSCLAS